MTTTSLWVLILAMSAVTAGSRVVGLFSARSASGTWERVLHYVPFGLFAAILVASGPGGGGTSWISFIPAMLVTGWAAWRGFSVAVSVSAGFVTLALISAVTAA